MEARVYSPPTKRRAMTRARATRIFVSRDGICFICTMPIRDGEDWFVEHPDPVSQGGSDDDADLWPAHMRCKPEKDAVDAGRKAKRDRIVTAGWVDKARGRGFRGWRNMRGEAVWKDQR